MLVACVLLLSMLLAGCQVDLYRGLTEYQANEMLSALLRRNIPTTKIDGAKNGFSVTVDEKNLVQALEILKENSLPGEKYQTLGSIFSGQGMISSPAEEQSRLAFAISQELSNTFSRIDGVLTARVHIVLGDIDKATDTKTVPSAAVFLRHSPESPVVNLVTKIRELTAKAVPGLGFEQVSVLLVPAREAVSVPYTPPQSFWQALYQTLLKPDGTVSLPMLLAFVLVSLGAVLGTGALYAVLRKRWRLAPPDAAKPQ
ncbi:MAG: type III secretion inner membrane ring lipoprotein SctJ [Bilophila sp.]